MTPFTFLACTYNLWGTARWEERRLPLERFLTVNEPDVFCVQELTEDSRTLIETTLPDLCSVDDPFPGWTQEGNIFWNSNLFDLVPTGPKTSAFSKSCGVSGGFVSQPRGARRLLSPTHTSAGQATFANSPNG